MAADAVTRRAAPSREPARARACASARAISREYLFDHAGTCALCVLVPANLRRSKAVQNRASRPVPPPRPLASRAVRSEPGQSKQEDATDRC